MFSQQHLIIVFVLFDTTYIWYYDSVPVMFYVSFASCGLNLSLLLRLIRVSFLLFAKFVMLTI